MVMEINVEEDEEEVVGCDLRTGCVHR